MFCMRLELYTASAKTHTHTQTTTTQPVTGAIYFRRKYTINSGNVRLRLLFSFDSSSAAEHTEA